MVVFAHPTGNANVRQAAIALAEAGLMREFWTCLNWNPRAWYSHLAPVGMRKQFARRACDPALLPYLHTLPLREVIRLFAPKLGLGRITQHESPYLSVDAIYHHLDRSVARRLSRIPDLSAVYMSEDGALSTFQRAKELGLHRLYDLPIGYWRAGHSIYKEEIERMPAWASTIPGLRDSDEKLARKDEELRLAEVVYVASSFTRKTLEYAPSNHAIVHTIPYGAPSSIAEQDLDFSTQKRLRVLFVGSLSQRKGLSYLLDAVNALRDHVDVTFIGKRVENECRPLEEALRCYRWIDSLPHSEILKEMRQHDVLVFPSLFEGFGLVLLEALSQGLPVIATPHTAAPDLITHGKEGFLVPIRDSVAITECLETLLRQPELRKAMRMASLAKAEQLPWQHYRKQLAQSVQSQIEVLQKGSLPQLTSCNF